MDPKPSVMTITAIDNRAKAFRKNGLLIIPKVFDASEIKAINDEATLLWQTQKECVPQNLRLGLRADESGGKILDRLDPVEDISKIFYQLNRNASLLLIAEALLGESVVVLKEKLIYKEPGSGGFAAHRDDPYFNISGVPGEQTISIAVALEGAYKENGGIEFFPEQRLKDLASPAEEVRDIDETFLSNSKKIRADLSPGDVVIYDALIPHRSNTNRSNTSRRTYTITYAPARYEGCRDKYYKERLKQQEKERETEFDGPFFII